MFILLESPNCSIVTAKGMYDLAAGGRWLQGQQVNSEYIKKYVALVHRILARFPDLK